MTLQHSLAGVRVLSSGGDVSLMTTALEDTHTIAMESIVTCPHCGHAERVAMSEGG